MAGGAMNMSALLLAVMLATCANNAKAQSNVTTYTLGFLAPTADSAIPASLANEWNSAFKVALEVLNSENQSYMLVPNVQASQCDWQAAERGAKYIAFPTAPPVIGVVGPACSGAAMSAARYLMDFNISLVSFAATAEPLSIRELFPNFFRTVYGDMHQAAAVVASMVKLEIQKVTMVLTQSYYSWNLGQNINMLINGSTTVHSVTLGVGDSSSINATMLGSALDSVESNEFVVLAVEPLQALNIWQAAYSMGKVGYPYWYFGTDGVTAFDPADANITDPSMVAQLVGEIGVSPYGGNFSSDAACNKFYSYWQAKNYSGLLSGGQNRSRSYVPYLIDAVTAYFSVIDNLIKANITVNALNVLQAFNGSGPGSPVFEGCTGVVSFDPETGSRNATAQIPIFDFVSLTPSYWEARGQIQGAKFQSLQTLTRPGSGSASPHKFKVGITVGTLVGLASVLTVIVGGTYYYLRNKKRSITRTDSMARMWER